MFRKTFFILAATLLMASGSKAQLADKANFFGGFTYQVIGTTPPGSPAPWNHLFYGLSLGMDYVLLHSNDQVSLGVNPNFNFSFRFSSFQGVSLLAQAPVYLLARIGAGSTPYNEQKFGIGAGIGGAYSYMLHSIPASDPTSVFNVNYNNGWINPSAVVEVSLKTRWSDYLFRFNWSLAKPSHDVDLDIGGVLPFRFGATGLSILYTF